MSISRLSPACAWIAGAWMLASPATSFAAETNAVGDESSRAVASQFDSMAAHPSPDRGLILSPRFAINLPQPLVLGLIGREAGKTHLQYFADLGFFRYPFIGGDRSFSAYSIQAGARYSPWENRPYFGSAALGYRSLGATLSMSNYTIDGVALANQGTISLQTIYASIAIGADWKVSSSLLLGFDIGAQIPLVGWGGMSLANTETGENSSNSDTLAMDSADAIGRWAQLTIPQITLIRLTWLLP